MALQETVKTLNGNIVTRVKSSVFFWAAFLAFAVGVYLLTQEVYVGASLIITLAPCLLLYPLIRLLFGGKDSVAAVVTTVVVEEVVKSKVINALEKKKRKR